MVYDSTRGNVILFGGVDPDETGGFGILYADTWGFNPSTRTWAAIPTTGTPDGRRDHAMAYDSIRRRRALFGGKDPNGPYPSDTREFAPATQTWTQAAPGGSAPLGRRPAAAPGTRPPTAPPRRTCSRSTPYRRQRGGPQAMRC